MILTREGTSSPEGPLEVEVDVPGIDVPGEATILLDSPGRWRVSVKGENVWAPEQSLVVGEAGGDLEFEVFPAGYLEAGLRSTGDLDLPAFLSVRFQASDTKSAGFKPSVGECEVREAQAACLLPAGKLDVRVEAEGFIPHYFWGVEIPWKAKYRAGTLDLQKGSSVIGWIEAPSREFLFEQVDVNMALLGSAALSSLDRQRSEQTRLEAKVDAQGFFQFRGVSPGRYALIATHPAFAPTRLDLDVGKDSEVELAPLALSPAANLLLQVRYPTDPYLKPWTLVMSRRGFETGHLEVVVDEKVNLEGLFEHGGFAPGEYQLTLGDSRGNRWYTESFELFPGENVREATIQFRRLEGTVILEDEPLPSAHVELREHEGNAFFQFQTDDAGKFYAFLRAGAEWDLKVIHEDLGVAAAFSRVVVPPTEPGENHAKKTFEIPDTRLFGEVVELTGEPVADPVVMSFSDESTGVLFQRPLRRGSFDLRGLQPGSIRIEAEIDGSLSPRRASSQQLRLQLTEGLEQGPIRLVLEDSRSLSGLVVAPGGQGVPGARVVALVENRDGISPSRWVPEATTDLEGVFDLALPAVAHVVQLTVFPPGFAIAQQRIPLREDTPPVIVPVDTAGARLIVRYELPELDRRGVTRQARLGTTILAPNVVHSAFLMAWSQTNGVSSPDPAAWTIPMLAPGFVQVCFDPRVRALVSRGGGGRRCPLS